VGVFHTKDIYCLNYARQDPAKIMAKLLKENIGDKYLLVYQSFRLRIVCFRTNQRKSSPFEI